MARLSGYDEWLLRGSDRSGEACPGCKEEVDEAALVWTDSGPGWQKATHDCGRVLWLYDEVTA